MFNIIYVSTHVSLLVLFRATASEDHMYSTRVRQKPAVSNRDEEVMQSENVQTNALICSQVLDLHLVISCTCCMPLIGETCIKIFKLQQLTTSDQLNLKKGLTFCIVNNPACLSQQIKPHNQSGTLRSGGVQASCFASGSAMANHLCINLCDYFRLLQLFVCHTRKIVVLLFTWCCSVKYSFSVTEWNWEIRHSSTSSLHRAPRTYNYIASLQDAHMNRTYAMACMLQCLQNIRKHRQADRQLIPPVSLTVESTQNVHSGTDQTLFEEGFRKLRV